MSAQLMLRIHSAQGTTEFVPTRPEVTVGRAPDNDVVLPDPSVSGHHARLIATAEGYRVSDVGSTNGTYLNAQRLPPQAWRALNVGDTLTVGPYAITIVPGTGAQPPVTAAGTATGEDSDGRGWACSVTARPGTATSTPTGPGVR